MPSKRVTEVEIERIPEAIKSLRDRGHRVTQEAVAHELGTDRHLLSRMLKKYPEVKALYDDALGSDLSTHG